MRPWTRCSGRGADSLAPQRRAYRTYCLGEWLGPDAPKEFLRVAGDLVSR